MPEVATRRGKRATRKAGRARRRRTKRRATRTAPLRGLDILVVDDRSTDRHQYEAWLRLAGAKVKAARSIAEAREILASWTPHVLVVNRLVQDGDGFETLGREALLRRIAVVVTSGYFCAEALDAVEQTAAVPAPKDQLLHADILAAFVRRACQQARATPARKTGSLSRESERSPLDALRYRAQRGVGRVTLMQALEATRDAMLDEALRQSRGSKRGAAERLGVDRKVLQRRSRHRPE